MKLLGRHGHEDSQKDLQRRDRNNQLAVDENRNVNMEQDATANISLQHELLESSTINALFDSTNDLFVPMLLPLSPFKDALIFVSNCDEREKRLFQIKVHIAIEKRKNKVHTSDELDLLDALQANWDLRINNSLNGFMIRELMEGQKHITIREEVEKKKGFLG
jgi:hypothetical protein